ncbi:MutS family DNA mismatch repair protein [Pseudobacteroides cellulosolvens]|uniref:DNA mismatch repair protein MutS domain protein n=1 Tax=Pseudobacteroides cellulosolvens ATCC 35603 = DSM 2933 TaxID=398512 RepID=A0A0L6JX33_9FIRM|nr:MutS family DNA mismatch repair protein [Pseudobacteroides cellulosolvens]KNY30411.1 DNA mismatch repair protein MutS domain protein [Pseudobacteroides cellulosolvens ATCC 35603 = DSM 2933]
MKTPYDSYTRRKNKYDMLIQSLTKAINMVSNLRLAVFLVGLAAGVVLYLVKYYILLSAVIFVSIIVFIYLVIRHEKLIDIKKFHTFLLEINQNSIKRLEGKWHEFTDTGDEYNNSEHRYFEDLDIFGKGSLFQWINTSKTYYGRSFFKDILGNTPKCIEDITERQQAVLELSRKLGWRQRFQAETMSVPDKTIDPDELIKWALDTETFYIKKWFTIFVKALPVFTGIVILLAMNTQFITFHIPVLLLLIQAILLRIKRKKRSEVFDLAEKYSNDIKVYYNALKHFEKHNFKSTHIKDIRAGMVNNEGLKAYKQLDRLSKIIDNISARHSAFFELLNILTLWDFQCMTAIEKWKQSSGKFLLSWIKAIGKVEALCGLAIISFDNPKWPMPDIWDSKPFIEAKGLGHPLLGQNGVSNDLKIKNQVKVLLITGSNMSGKSTLLRTVGINLVLAYAGAPVCAQSFSASIADIHTCMRVSDDLGKSISSFYAELLRIKEIVNRAESGEKVFFLLDEIFKGTNSRDRHMGARVLIKRLCQLNCSGLVSTHDLELSDLENEGFEVKNYHFEEYYKDNKINFDYKLREGVSTTRNAVYLMRLAGIDISE